LQGSDAISLIDVVESEEFRMLDVLGFGDEMETKLKELGIYDEDQKNPVLKEFLTASDLQRLLTTRIVLAILNERMRITNERKK